MQTPLKLMGAEFVKSQISFFQASSQKIDDKRVHRGLGTAPGDMYPQKKNRKIQFCRDQ